MTNCPFCNIDKNKIENTIIEETDNFYIIPTVGSLVDGYLLIVSKEHLNSMSELDKSKNNEYKYIIEKYRTIFKQIYGKYPILFEHGTPLIKDRMKASSVIHAHTHIVNHNYLNEQRIINDLNFQKINSLQNISNKKNYIKYINPKGICYVTYKFDSISQIMRLLIADDLKYKDKFDWRKEPFIENINLTISKIKSFNDKIK